MIFFFCCFSPSFFLSFSFGFNLCSCMTELGATAAFLAQFPYHFSLSSPSLSPQRGREQGGTRSCTGKGEAQVKAKHRSQKLPLQPPCARWFIAMFVFISVFSPRFDNGVPWVHLLASSIACRRCPPGFALPSTSLFLYLLSPCGLWMEFQALPS